MLDDLFTGFLLPDGGYRLSSFVLPPPLSLSLVRNASCVIRSSFNMEISCACALLVSETALVTRVGFIVLYHCWGFIILYSYQSHPVLVFVVLLRPA